MSEKLRHPTSWDSHRFAEVQLAPKDPSIPVDHLLEILASRAPKVADFWSADGELDPELRRALHDALTPTQARRLEMVLRAEKLETIGHMEGVSKQAIWGSIRRALKKLKNDYRVLEVLCDMYPEAGLDARILVEVAHGYEERQRAAC